MEQPGKPSLEPVTGRQWLALAAITFLGIALRLYRIDWQSAWPDEIFTLFTVGADFSEMMRRIIHDFVHPPLHYFLLLGTTKVFGYGQLQARLLSMVFGSASIVVLFLLARQLFSLRTALVSALLLAVSQLGVNHSQEGRPYALALLLMLTTTYLFLRAIRERDARYWWASVAAAILTVYSHYNTIPVLIGLFGYYLCYRKRYPTPMRWWIGAALLVIVAYTPWILSGILERGLSSGKLAPDGGVMRVRWYSALSSLNWFHNGK